MTPRIASALGRLTHRLGHDEKGEVNVSMIAWMVVSALVVFAFRVQLTNMLTSAVGFVTTTLGI